MRIVTFSCKKYAWMRPLHEACLRNAWPDCPYPREWVSDDDGRGWSLTYHQWAARVGTEPTLILLDDYMVDFVDREAIAKAFDLCRPGVGCVRVRACPGPTLPYTVPGFGEIDKTLPYAVSLQAAVWCPAVLASLIVPGYSPWDVEIKGSVHASLTAWQFLGTIGDAITYDELTVKGVTRPESLAKATAIMEAQRETA